MPRPRKEVASLPEHTLKRAIAAHRIRAVAEVAEGVDPVHRLKHSGRVEILAGTIRDRGEALKIDLILLAHGGKRISKNE